MQGDVHLLAVCINMLYSFYVDQNISISVSLQTTLPDFKESDFSVVREHDEFVWLHDRYVENEEYGGVIVSNRSFNMYIRT